jgi:hypothetical protein
MKDLNELIIIHIEMNTSSSYKTNYDNFLSDLLDQSDGQTFSVVNDFCNAEIPISFRKAFDVFNVKNTQSLETGIKIVFPSFEEMTNTEFSKSKFIASDSGCAEKLWLGGINEKFEFTFDRNCLINQPWKEVFEIYTTNRSSLWKFSPMKLSVCSGLDREFGNLKPLSFTLYNPMVGRIPLGKLYGEGNLFQFFDIGA